MILEDRYLKEKEKDLKKGGKGGKGKSRIEKEKDKTEPPAKAARKDTTPTHEPPTTHSSQLRTKQAEKIMNSKTI